MTELEQAWKEWEMEQKKPREFWLNEMTGEFISLDTLTNKGYSLHVREVLTKEMEQTNDKWIIDLNAEQLHIKHLCAKIQELQARIVKLTEALDKIKHKPKWYKDSGHVCDSKNDLQGVIAIARKALEVDE